MIDVIDKNPSPLCKCGKPRQKVFVKWAGKYIHSKWCPECEYNYENEMAKQEIIHRHESIKKAIKREIEPIYYNSSLDDFSEQIKQVLIDKPADQGVLIWGKTGTGKSHLASALIKEALKAEQRAKMVRFKDMVLSIRASYDNNKTEESILRPFISCHLLSIEDIGTIRSGKVESDFCQDTLLTVIDARLQRNKPTIITTNLSPEDLWNAFGTRLASRFSTFLIFKLDGRDRRLDKN